MLFSLKTVLKIMWQIIQRIQMKSSSLRKFPSRDFLIFFILLIASVSFIIVVEKGKRAQINLWAQDRNYQIENINTQWFARYKGYDLKKVNYISRDGQHHTIYFEFTIMGTNIRN